MAGFEDSAEYKMAMQSYMRRQKAKAAAKNFVNGAKTLYTTINNDIIAAQINNRKNFRAGVHRVKEGIVSSYYKVKNGIEDKAYDMGERAKGAKARAGGFFNKISKSAQDKIDTVHYGLLVAKDGVNKAADTVHYGLLVAKDGVNKAVAPVRKVSKAAAHLFMASAGKVVGTTVRGVQKVADNVQRVGDKVVSEAKKAGTIVKVSTDKAKSFVSDEATKITLAGKNLGKNIVGALRSGGDRAYKAVGNTLSTAKSSIQKGIDVAKQNVEQASRSNSSVWFKAAYAQAKQSR